MNNNGRTFFLAIAGKSGSGKTALTESLAKSFVDLQPIKLSLDSYYLDLSDLEPAARELRNFDHPGALDWDTLIMHLTSLRKGTAIEEPMYHFSSHTRLMTTKRIQPFGMVIIEGLYALHARIRGMMDVSVFIELVDELALERRLNRDVVERGRSRDSVIAQFHEQTRPAYEQYVLPLKQHADVVVQGNKSLDDMANPVIALVNTVRAKGRGENGY